MRQRGHCGAAFAWPVAACSSALASDSRFRFWYASSMATIARFAAVFSSTEGRCFGFGSGDPPVNARFTPVSGPRVRCLELKSRK